MGLVLEGNGLRSAMGSYFVREDSGARVVRPDGITREQAKCNPDVLPHHQPIIVRSRSLAIGGDSHRTHSAMETGDVQIPTKVDSPARRVGGGRMIPGLSDPLDSCLLYTIVYIYSIWYME